MKKIAVFGILFGLAAFTICATASAEDLIRLHGAVTMGKLLEAKKDAIESGSGAKIEIVGNGSGRGLTDLAEASADIALVGGTVKGVAAVVNAEKPGKVDPAGLEEVAAGKVPLGMLTHPSAGVKSLTAAQAADVFSGKVKNWKEVGGADQEIKIVIPFPGDGARIILEEELLNGGDFGADPVVCKTSSDVAKIVAQLPGACSIITVKNIEGEVTKVDLDKTFNMPMLLVTKKDAADPVKKVVEAAKQALAQ